MPPPEFETVLNRLRSVLADNRGELTISEDSPTRYCLEAPVGPATIKAWRGKVKTRTIPVAWAQIGEAYVSFHHMALYVNSKLKDGLSEALRKRQHGRTCFNFRSEAEVPASELAELMARGCKGMRSAGFIQ